MATGDVAEAEGVTIDAIYMRKYRARKRLQRLGVIPVNTNLSPPRRGGTSTAPAPL